MQADLASRCWLFSSLLFLTFAYSGGIFWEKTYTKDRINNSFIVSPDESYVFYLNNDATFLEVMQLNANDGSISTSQSISNYLASDSFYFIELSSDGASLYIIANEITSSNEASLCRYQVVAQTWE